MAKKYRVKGSTRRKMMKIEMSKELRANAKKTNPSRATSPEHEAFRLLESGE